MVVPHWPLTVSNAVLNFCSVLFRALRFGSVIFASALRSEAAADLVCRNTVFLRF